MTHILTECPKSTSRFSGVLFEVWDIFSEGHVCNSLEAKRLNAAVVSDMRGEVNGDLKALVGPARGRDEDDPIEISDEDREKFQEIIRSGFEGFEFSSIVRIGRSADPVLKRALEIVRGPVVDALKARGVSGAEFTQKSITAQCKSVLKNNPQVMELAKTQVEAGNLILA